MAQCEKQCLCFSSRHSAFLSRSSDVPPTGFKLFTANFTHLHLPTVVLSLLFACFTLLLLNFSTFQQSFGGLGSPSELLSSACPFVHATMRGGKKGHEIAYGSQSERMPRSNIPNYLRSMTTSRCKQLPEKAKEGKRRQKKVREGKRR